MNLWHHLRVFTPDQHKLMNETLKCQVCDDPRTYDECTESVSLGSNVKQFAKERFTVWRCANCSTLHSREAVDLGPYYERYPIKKLRRDYFLKKSYENRLGLMKKVGLLESHRILDYGCSEGQFLDFLRSRGYTNVCGYDAFIDRFADETVLDESYDAVISQDVIEHVDDPNGLMKTLAGLLQPGGLLVIGTPNASEISLSKPDDFSLELHQPYHRHILSRQSLLAMGTRSSLTEVMFHPRIYNDTLWPAVNARFIWTYVKKAGNYLDVLVEKPRLKMVFTSPLLMFYLFFGYFMRHPGNMMVFFRKDA